MMLGVFFTATSREEQRLRESVRSAQRGEGQSEDIKMVRVGAELVYVCVADLRSFLDNMTERCSTRRAPQTE